MKELPQTVRALILLLAALMLASVAVPAMADGRVTSYTTWDQNYFYLAAQVDDNNVIGSNTKPNSKPWLDDDIEVFLEVDNKHAPNRTNRTFQMCVSPAGGSSWIVGDAGLAKPKPVFSYKYSINVQGTLNQPDDVDTGYTIELAMPWVEMGVQPSPGLAMSFNIVIHYRGGEDRILSLSAKVKNDDDAQIPANWVNIVLTGPAFAAVTADLEKIVSAKYITRMPLIDGQIKPKEWNQNTSFDITIPETPEQRAAQRPIRSLQKLALTYYFYWYQGDSRRPIPLGNVRHADGRSALTDHPAHGEGPWFSYDRVLWHKEELQEIHNCGIDVVLPVYWGDKQSRAEFASKGLDCMVEALKELRAEKKSYPLVGMFFDTTSMQRAYGGEKPDLKDPEVKRAFYGMIRDFFLRVPKEFRATAHILDERGNRPTYIVDLYTASFFSDIDPSVFTYCNEQFQADFGAKLCWLGSSDWKSKCPGLDGYCSYGAGFRLQYDDAGMIRMAAIGAGYDDSAVQGRSTPIRARMDGKTYKEDWAVANTKRPAWIIIDGWNEFLEGTDICSSRQYGYQFVSATALQLARIRTQKEFNLKVLWQNAPAGIAPGGLSQVTFLLKNDGLKIWRASEGYALIYTWFKDGRPYQEGMGTHPLQADLMPGQSSEVTVGVAAVVQSTEIGNEQKPVPLAEGDYDLVFEMVRLLDNKKFTALGDEPFVIPIRIANPSARAATFISVVAPTMVQGGKDYPVRVRVRNDGNAAWSASNVKLNAKMYKSQSYTHDTKDMLEPVDLAFASVALPKDVPAGESIEIVATLNAKDAAGNALPSWSHDQLWSYLLRWEIADEMGAITSNDQILDVFDRDAGATFVDSDLPYKISAGKTYEVKVVLRNSGTETWKPRAYAIGTHWYYLDGVEMQWDGQKTPIKEEIKQGEVRVLTAQVTAPAYDGQYRVVFDLAIGDRWASTEPITHGGDILQKLVSVTDGKLVFVDLAQAFDTDVISSDADTKNGNFDGQGHSFPAEILPPDIADGKVYFDIYPSGYWWAGDSGPQSQRRISFLYPKATEAKNAISCDGQKVIVPSGKYKAIHMIGAASEENTKGALVLSYADITGTAKIGLSSWAEEPKNGEKTGFVTLHRHSTEGDERGVKCYLHHVTVELDASRNLSALELPKNQSMKILAVTLERAD